MLLFSVEVEQAVFHPTNRLRHDYDYRHTRQMTNANGNDDSVDYVTSRKGFLSVMVKVMLTVMTISRYLFPFIMKTDHCLSSKLDRAGVVL